MTNRLLIVEASLSFHCLKCIHYLTVYFDCEIMNAPIQWKANDIMISFYKKENDVTTTSFLSNCNLALKTDVILIWQCLCQIRLTSVFKVVFHCLFVAILLSILILIFFILTLFHFISFIVWQTENEQKTTIKQRATRAQI